MADISDTSLDKPSIPSVYKYSWQFDEAMKNDAFAKALYEEQRSLPRVRTAIWLGVGLFFVLYMANASFGWGLWVFHWLQLSVGPFFHLLFWPLFLAFSWHYYRTYDPKRLITRNLLCFGCGYSLRGVPVDENYRGRCPECGRAYSLGEYVHPRHPEKYPQPPVVLRGARVSDDADAET